MLGTILVIAVIVAVGTRASDEVEVRQQEVILANLPEPDAIAYYQLLRRRVRTVAGEARRRARPARPPGPDRGMRPAWACRRRERHPRGPRRCRRCSPGHAGPGSRGCSHAPGRPR